MREWSKTRIHTLSEAARKVSKDKAVWTDEAVDYYKELDSAREAEKKKSLKEASCKFGEQLYHLNKKAEREGVVLNEALREGYRRSRKWQV